MDLIFLRVKLEDRKWLLELSGMQSITPLALGLPWEVHLLFSDLLHK